MKTEEPGAPKPPRKPRKDKATRRVALPVWLVKDLEQLAKEGHHAAGIEPLLVLWATQAAAVIPGRAVTLPPSVLARLEPAAEGSGRSISELLAEMEGDLVELLDGRLGRYELVPGVGVQGLYTNHEVAALCPVPSLEDRLVEAFRARIRAAQATEPADVVELKEAIKAGLERA